MGKFKRILEPGLNFLIPFLDRVGYVQSLKELAVDIPKQTAVTLGKLSTLLNYNYFLKNKIHYFRQCNSKYWWCTVFASQWSLLS